MKLKKIASLALVGVMAVSMFAGCSDAPVDDNQGDDNQVITTSPVVSALNDAQDKVEFSSDSYLTSAMSQVVTKVGTDSTIDADEMAEYIAAATGYEQNATDFDDFNGEKEWHNIFYGRGYYTWENIGKNGDSKTVIKVEKVDSSDAYNEEAAIRVATRNIANDVEDLNSTTFAADDNQDNILPTENGEEYADYTYTGTVSDIVTVKDVEGTITYYVVYTVTQNTAVKTFTV